MSTDPRMAKALEMLEAIEDEDAADAVVKVLNKLAPDYARSTVAYAFGDTYGRTDKLALRDREIATIAALAAMGTAQPQLKVHIRSGLKVGLTQQEIVEIIHHVGVYAGFPAAANAYFAMNEALEESKKAQRKRGGLAAAKKVAAGDRGAQGAARKPASRRKTATRKPAAAARK